MMHKYTSLEKLRNGEILEIDGLKLKMVDGPIQKGDFYVAERNTGPQLLIARKVDENIGCIFPDGFEYPYDIHECVKVSEDS